MKNPTEFYSVKQVENLFRSQKQHKINHETTKELIQMIEYLLYSHKVTDEKLSGKKCNAGHENHLPVTLWDCPTCTEILRLKHRKAMVFIENLENDDGSIPSSIWKMRNDLIKENSDE